VGQARLFALLREAGIGKSRLVAELAAEATRRARELLIGHCHESEQVLPFGPWVEALRSARRPAMAASRCSLPRGARH